MTLFLVLLVTVYLERVLCPRPPNGSNFLKSSRVVQLHPGDLRGPQFQEQQRNSHWRLVKVFPQGLSVDLAFVWTRFPLMGSSLRRDLFTDGLQVPWDNRVLESAVGVLLEETGGPLWAWAPGMVTGPPKRSHK